MGKHDLEYCADLIRSGEPVAFPTETVYGLGADAWNPGAIRKIFELKERPADNPLIVHIAYQESIDKFSNLLEAKAARLIQHYWPGPLTIVLKKKKSVLDLITAGKETVAIRNPDNPYALELIRRTGPVVAPSANKSGRPSPTEPRHVMEDFGADFPILDGGSCRIGLESTVLDTTVSPLEILRPGYISKHQIEEVIDEEVRSHTTRGDANKTHAKSPGMKYSHYAPEAEVRWLKKGDEPDKTDNLYILHSETASIGYEKDHVIEYSGRYTLMARELYDRFRQADIEGYNQVAIESFTPEQQKDELTGALYNRISKAIG